MRSCTTSSIKRLVSSVLMNDRYMEWSFVSGSVFDDACQADFIQKRPGLEQRLVCVENESGVRWDVSTVAPVSTVA